MPESAVIAYFKSPDLANGAIEHLRNRGFDTVQMDTFSHFPDAESADRYFNPRTGDERRSLTALVEGIPGGGDTRPLAAAMPTASGMADNATFVSGENYIVTVVCDSNQLSEAQQLLAAYGGNVGVEPAK